MRSLILVNTNELIFAINSQPTYFLALKYDPFSPSAADASFGALRTFVLNLNQNSFLLPFLDPFLFLNQMKLAVPAKNIVVPAAAADDGLPAFADGKTIVSCVQSIGCLTQQFVVHLDGNLLSIQLALCFRVGSVAVNYCAKNDEGLSHHCSFD